MVSLKVSNDNVKYNSDNTVLTSSYTYQNSIVSKQGETYTVKPFTKDYEFQVDLKVPKVGLLLVGLGGNNGTTFVSAVESNKQKIVFNTKDGEIKSNYFGSVTQASTVKIGIDESGKDVYVPFNSILPLVDPNDLIVSGWDINGENLQNAAKRAKVLSYDLQSQLGSIE
ncbi:hypothetical protein WICANDRAFT_60007 [Wickerhamomyces anomalus NRRL Y-366-8]|uniref:Uncharacterized protein n=1 Tax=Wickerhamomyces anomalus (strain ATCC 58044 / CBS 1984 / NCYC 433 / NRRL Y-366-8) TaxID=683960 RepID=A0A1E3P9Q2_WICAA|nr:uncharacterized protein WICANDRAFT_60007 [Wickerhamomyces anomalus NRRL Y-366-8]ODQ61934.1 hypothetical protein WICANDRAFT_60007 [Wickerhamomyces anomalus NRRL Y-366-8]